MQEDYPRATTDGTDTQLPLERAQLDLLPSENCPRRGLFIDWLSVTAKFEKDDAVEALVLGVKAAVLDHFGTKESRQCDFNGNYLDGIRFPRAGIQLRWTTFTACTLIGANEEGRCAGTMNLIASGKSGIGQIPLDRAISFTVALWQLGFRSSSRCDVAMDIHEYPPVSPAAIHRHLQSGRWRVPRKRDFALYAGFKQGEDHFETPTLYIGNIKSDNYCRIYDRAAVLDLDHECARFERQTRGKFSQVLVESLVGAGITSYEGPSADQLLCRWALAAIRTSCDFRDVSSLATLSSNWANLTEPPAVIDRIFGEVAPLEIGDVVVKGGFASSFRHAQRASARVLCLHCLLLKATKGRVANDLLSICGQRLEDLSEEDFQDLLDAHPEITMVQVREAHWKLLNQWYEHQGLEIRAIGNQFNEDVKTLKCELGVQ